jgi:hypothetical protein
MGTRASNLVRRRRVEQVLKLRLAGATFPDIRTFAHALDPEQGTPWTGPGGKLLSDRGLWRLAHEADKVFLESLEKERPLLVAHHVLLRRLIRARALEQGDNRAALAAAADECRLLGLYPEQQAKAGAANTQVVNIWGPVLQRMGTEQLAQLTALAESALSGVNTHDVDSRGPLPVSGEAAPDPAGPAPGGDGAAGELPPILPDLCRPDVDPL